MGKVKEQQKCEEPCEASSNTIIQDTSGVLAMYCLLCDEVITNKTLCKHQGIKINELFQEYVTFVNKHIDDKQKEARSIQFYLATSRALNNGKNVQPFHILNIYGFKYFIKSKFI